LAIFTIKRLWRSKINGKIIVGFEEKLFEIEKHAKTIKTAFWRPEKTITIYF